MRCCTCSRPRPAATGTGGRAGGPTTAGSWPGVPARSSRTTWPPRRADVSAGINFALVLNLHQPRNGPPRRSSGRSAGYRARYGSSRTWPGCTSSVSGTLLETLTDPDFQRRVYGTVVCGSLLWHLQNTRVIDILGPGYHPVSLVVVARTQRAAASGLVVTGGLSSFPTPGPDLPSRSALSGSEVARWGVLALGQRAAEEADDALPGRGKGGDQPGGVAGGAELAGEGRGDLLHRADGLPRRPHRARHPCRRHRAGAGRPARPSAAQAGPTHHRPVRPPGLPAGAGGLLRTVPGRLPR